MTDVQAETLDLDLIRARCGKGHAALRRLVGHAERFKATPDPMADGVTATEALADVPALVAEVERLRAKVEADRAVEAATKEVIAWHRVECGCLGGVCGYGNRLVNLGLALRAALASHDGKDGQK